MEFNNLAWCGTSVTASDESPCPTSFFCTNCTNPAADNDSIKIAQTFFICLISIVNVLTNVLLLLIIPRAEWLPRGTKQILLSLVYTDMGKGFLGLISAAAAANNRWPLAIPEGICWLQGFFYLIFVDVSILNQALIPLDLVITQVRTTQTPRGIINMLILLTWFISTVSAGLREYITTEQQPYFFYNPKNYGCLGGLFDKKYDDLRQIMMAIFIIIPLIVVISTYSLLYGHRAYKIRRASSIVHPQPPLSRNDSNSLSNANGTVGDFENGERISADSRTNGSSYISAQPDSQPSSLNRKFIDLTLHTTAIKTTPWITLYFYCILFLYFLHTVLHHKIPSDLKHAHWIDFFAYWVLSLASTGNLFILLFLRSECRSQLKQLLKRAYSSIKQCRNRNQPSDSETEEVRRQSRLREFSQLYSQAIRSPVAGPSSR